MKKRLGVYEFGLYRFEIFIDADLYGATFDPTPFENKKAMPELIIGLFHKEKDWFRVVANILHEIQEAIMLMMGFRFERALSYGWNTDRYVFYMDHPQFTDVINMVAEGFPKLYEDVKKYFYELKKKEEKKK